MWGFGGYILTGLMRKEFGFTNAQLGLLNSASSISWALFQIPIGRLIQGYGCKISLILSEAIGVLAIMGFVFSDRFESFLIFEIPMGLVPALWIPAINTLIANATSEEERAEAFGRLWLLRRIVGFPGPIIGGFIYQLFWLQCSSDCKYGGRHSGHVSTLLLRSGTNLNSSRRQK